MHPLEGHIISRSPGLVQVDAGLQVLLTVAIRYGALPAPGVHQLLQRHQPIEKATVRDGQAREITEAALGAAGGEVTAVRFVERIL